MNHSCQFYTAVVVLSLTVYVVVNVPYEVLVMFKNGFPWNWDDIMHATAEKLVIHS